MSPSLTRVANGPVRAVFLCTLCCSGSLTWAPPFSKSCPSVRAFLPRCLNCSLRCRSLLPIRLLAPHPGTRCLTSSAHPFSCRPRSWPRCVRATRLSRVRWSSPGSVRTPLRAPDPHPPRRRLSRLSGRQLRGFDRCSWGCCRRCRAPRRRTPWRAVRAFVICRPRYRDPA